MGAQLNKYIILIASLGCVIFSIVLAYLYMVDIPNADDYGVYLGFINGIESDLPLSTKLGSAVGLQNEHRPLIERLIALGQYKLTGKVNFLILMLIGNLFWIGSLINLMKTLKIKPGVVFFLFLIVLFFNLNHWENMYWATGSLQNFGIVFFTLLSFRFAIKGGNYHFWAIMVSGIAFYTSGNGLYAMLIVVVYLMIKGTWKIKLFGLIYTVLLIWSYFWNYVSPPMLSSPVFNLTNRPMLVIEYFLSYFAGSFYLLGVHEKWLVLLVGVLVSSLAIIALIKSFGNNRFLFMIILFCLLSIASASLARAQFGYIQATTPRYQVLNALIYFSVGFVFLSKVRLNLLFTSLVCSMLISLFILAYSQNRARISEYHVKFKRSAYCHKIDKPFSEYVFPIPIIAWAILVQSEQLGVYKMPAVKEAYKCD